MRRLAAFLLPIVALVLACMQEMPGDGQGEEDAPGCRIGGVSVGCNNPTKTADVRVDAKNCGGTCGASQINIRFTLSFDSAIHLRFLPFAINVEGDPDSQSVLTVFVRYAGQMRFLDSLPLDTLLFSATDSLNIEFSRLCAAVDRPDSLCSKKLWSQIPVTLELHRSLFKGNLPQKRIGYIPNVILNTHDKTLSPAPQIPASESDSGVLLIDYAQLTDSIHWERPLEKGSFRIVYIPGTNSASVLCSDTQPLDLLGLVAGKYSLQTITVPRLTRAAWLPVSILDSVTVETGYEPRKFFPTFREIGFADSLWLPANFGHTSDFHPCP